MAVTESFLVNTDTFIPIIEALTEREEAPGEITDELFASMGFDSPSELLVIHMLKELNMLTMDGEPTELYYKLTNPETTDEAVAIGIVHAYTDLFKENRELYKLPKDDIRAVLEEYFEGRKTDLILKYMTNTFHTLVNFAGFKNMQEAVTGYFRQESEEETATEPVPDESGESTAVSAEEQHEQSDTDETVADTEEAGKKEESEAVVDEEEPLDEERETDTDEAFDDIFFDNDRELSAGGAEEHENEEDEVEESAEPVTSDKEKGSINFEELPKVQSEEKGSGSIDEFLNVGADTEQEERTADTASPAEDETIAESQEETATGSDETTDYTDTESEENDKSPTEHNQEASESLSEEEKETLEKELMEIDMESTNGLHTNGAKKTEKPMKNLSSLPTKDKVEKALIKKAELLYKLEKFEEVLPAYKDIIGYFDNSETEMHRQAVASAVINRVSVLKKLNREDELLPALEEVIGRFRDSSVNEYYEKASLAMLDKAELLDDETAEELLPLYEDIIDRLRNATTSNIKSRIDEIFIKRVDLLGETGSEQKLLKAVDELIERFEGSEAHSGQLEEAMYKKAEILENLGRDEEALEAYSEFLEKFGKTKEMV